MELILAIMEAAKQKKGLAVFILIVIPILLITVPIAVNKYLDDRMNENIDRSLIEIKESIHGLDTNIKDMHQNLELMNNEIRKINVDREKEALEEAVIAYSKVFTLEQLKSSPLKRLAIKRALQTEEGKEFLLSIDHSRTIMFYNYFFPEG